MSEKTLFHKKEITHIENKQIMLATINSIIYICTLKELKFQISKNWYQNFVNISSLENWKGCSHLLQSPIYKKVYFSPFTWTKYQFVEENHTVKCTLNAPYYM